MKPLFHENAEEIKRQLRLGNLPGGGEGEELFSTALAEARASFWEHLGPDRIGVLTAIVPNDPPSTDNDYLHLAAKLAEVSLVRYHLAARMPIAWRDGKPEFLSSYQTEGTTQKLDVEQSERLRDVWWNDPAGGIERKLTLLRDGPTKPTDLTGRVASRGTAPEDYVDFRNLALSPGEVTLTQLMAI